MIKNVYCASRKVWSDFNETRNF